MSRGDGTLNYADRQTIRGLLKDKQSAKTIAEEYAVRVEDILALSAPKPVCQWLIVGSVSTSSCGRAALRTRHARVACVFSCMRVFMHARVCT